MKKQSQPNGENVVTLRLWSHEGAVKAIPYLRSLSQSLREEWLTFRQAKAQVERLESRPGRPDREVLIRLEDLQRELAHTEEELDETVREMQSLSAFCVDPAAGQVAIPFLHQNELAWYLFDMFDEQGFVGWRMHTDALEVQRPMAELNPQPPTAGAA